MSTSELWPIAVHEAGHAVVSVYYEIPFTQLFITPDGSGGLMFNMKKHEVLLKSPAQVRYASRLIVSCYSGFVGHRRVFPSVSREGVKDDTNHAGGLLHYYFKYERILDKNTGKFRCPIDAEIEILVKRRARRLWRVTQRLVRRLFPVIQVVARALLERKRMTGEEVVALAGPLIANKRAACIARQRRARSSG